MNTCELETILLRKSNSDDVRYHLNCFNEIRVGANQDFLPLEDQLNFPGISNSESDSSFQSDLDPETLKIKEITQHLTKGLKTTLTRYRRTSKHYSSQEKTYRNLISPDSEDLGIINSINELKAETALISQNIENFVETLNTRHSKLNTEERCSPSINEDHLYGMLHDMEFELKTIKEKFQLAKEETSDIIHLQNKAVNEKSSCCSLFCQDKKVPGCNCLVF